MVAVQAYNASTRRAKEGRRIMSSRTTWTTKQGLVSKQHVQGDHGEQESMRDTRQGVWVPEHTHGCLWGERSSLSTLCDDKRLSSGLTHKPQDPSTELRSPAESGLKIHDSPLLQAASLPNMGVYTTDPPPLSHGQALVPGVCPPPPQLCLVVPQCHLTLTHC